MYWHVSFCDEGVSRECESSAVLPTAWSHLIAVTRDLHGGLGGRQALRLLTIVGRLRNIETAWRAAWDAFNPV